MATIVDKTACELAASGAEDGLLPVNPFNALQFHFVMLLGVDDLETGPGISAREDPATQCLAAPAKEWSGV
jgi:hypothetical protein